MNSTLTPGTEVIYGLHGRCAVTSIEDRTVNSESIRFYKLQPIRSVLGKPKIQDTAIWIPVASASQRGLRTPMDPVILEEVWAVLSSREYYFSVETPWSENVKKLEITITTEGAIGLAKVASFLYVLKKRQIVPPTEVSRFAETVFKVLTRELADTSGETLRSVEERLEKLLQHKLKPDT